MVVPEIVTAEVEAEGQLFATDIGGVTGRAEMRRIRAAIAQAVEHPYDPPHTPSAADNLHIFLATQFRSMKRLWHNDPRSDGDLCDRREAEARLILEEDHA